MSVIADNGLHREAASIMLYQISCSEYFPQQASDKKMMSAEFTIARYVCFQTYKILNEIQPKISLGV